MHVAGRSAATTFDCALTGRTRPLGPASGVATLGGPPLPSKQVQDPAQMRELVRRGEQAMAEAQRVAEAGRHDLMAAPPTGRRCPIIVSMASPALIGDVSHIVFRRSAHEAAVDLLNGQLAFPAISGFHQNRVGGDVGQGAFTLFNAGFHEEAGYSIKVGRHGSVAVGQSAGLVDDGLRAVADSADALRRTWQAAADLIMAYAGDVPVHAAVELGGDRFGWTEMARWTQVPGPVGTRPGILDARGPADPRPR